MKTQNVDIPKETIAYEQKATERKEIEAKIEALTLGTKAVEVGLWLDRMNRRRGAIAPYQKSFLSSRRGTDE